MNLSRKEFFRKSIFSIGEAVGAATGLLKDPWPATAEEPQGPFVPAERPDLVAAPNAKTYCLAANSGCFACVERCDAMAITPVMGTGISVDPDRCTGCGTCEYVCPVTPKAVLVVPRTQKPLS